MKREILLLLISLLSIAACTPERSGGLHDETTTQTGAYGVTLLPSQNVYVSFDDMVTYYAETMACMGMTATGPEIRYVSFADFFNGAHGAPWAGYISKGHIFVNTDNLGLGFDRDARTDMEALKHEYIHHILDMNGAEWRHPHNGDMFKKCGEGVNTYN